MRYVIILLCLTACGGGDPDPCISSVVHAIETAPPGAIVGDVIEQAESSTPECSKHLVGK